MLHKDYLPSGLAVKPDAVVVVGSAEFEVHRALVALHSPGEFQGLRAQLPPSHCILLPPAARRRRHCTFWCCCHPLCIA